MFGSKAIFADEKFEEEVMIKSVNFLSSAVII
jgi:hypothetical protein